MKPVMINLTLIFCLFLGLARAGDLRSITLRDGSVITGEIVSFSNGTYTIKSDNLGIVELDQSKIISIQEKSSSRERSSADAANSSTGSATSREVQALQQKMMNDKEIFALIQSLQNDPEMQKLLQDPVFMKAVNENDFSMLLADPRFVRLMNNSTVQDIQKKAK